MQHKKMPAADAVAAQGRRDGIGEVRLDGRILRQVAERATRGLMYYMGEKHDDMMDAEKIRELRDYALQRRIRELTGRDDL